MQDKKKKFYLHPPSIFPILLVTILFIAIILFFVIGCGINTRSYSQDDSAINTVTGQQFSILFDSDLTNGYSWHPDYDIQMLEIVGKTYRKGEHTRPEIKKSDFSGIEYFTFKALQKGEANITFVYERVGEKKVIKEKIFTILIK